MAVKFTTFRQLFGGKIHYFLVVKLHALSGRRHQAREKRHSFIAGLVKSSIVPLCYTPRSPELIPPYLLVLKGLLHPLTFLLL